jgi:hypothetical protein
MNNPDHNFLELRNILSGMEKIRIRDAVWKNVGSGINIPDPQSCKKDIFTNIKKFFKIWIDRVRYGTLHADPDR